MIYEKDWVMRQIKSSIETIARLVLGKGPVSHEEYLAPEVIDLHLYIEKLINQGDINKAENFLFEKMSRGDINMLSLALSFYSRLNEMSDEELKSKNFSRSEIQEGVTDITKAYGLELPFIDSELL